MIFNQIDIEGVFVIEPEEVIDERGFFARIWDKDRFKKLGLETDVSQCSISLSNRKGTLRGMHYQEKPFEEVKIVRCTRGKIFDVIIDLRRTSLSFKKWFGIELTESNHKMLYVPKGFAHGYQTLEDNTEISYQISESYHPDHSKGILWNDPVFSINWPIKQPILSKRDSSFEPFQTNN